VITTGIDWDKWRHIPNPKLWEATLLLMGIDPDRYATIGDPEYELKLRILSANYWTIEDKPSPTGKDASPDMLVNLSRCAEWAATRWKIPPALYAIADTQENRTASLQQELAKNDGQVGTSKAGAQRVPTLPEATLKRWFEARVLTWPENKVPPREEDDLNAAIKDHPDHSVPRGQFRIIRRSLVPESWKKRGRRS
jgi:hypothetical protein